MSAGSVDLYSLVSAFTLHSNVYYSKALFKHVSQIKNCNASSKSNINMKPLITRDLSSLCLKITKLLSCAVLKT